MGELDRGSRIGFMRPATVPRNAEKQQRWLQENWGQQSQLHVSEPCQNPVDSGWLNRLAPADFSLYSIDSMCGCQFLPSNLNISLCPAESIRSLLRDRS
jgi:hypothetical protein